MKHIYAPIVLPLLAKNMKPFTQLTTTVRVQMGDSTSAEAECSWQRYSNAAATVMPESVTRPLCYPHQPRPKSGRLSQIKLRAQQTLVLVVGYFCPPNLVSSTCLVPAPLRCIPSVWFPELNPWETNCRKIHKSSYKLSLLLSCILILRLYYPTTLHEMVQ